MQKRALTILTLSLVIVIATGIATLKTVSRTPLADRDFFDAMSRQIDSLNIRQHTGENFLAGWSSCSIMPAQDVMLAGYGIRGPVDSVHDSLEVKATVIDNGLFAVALLSVDLLLFPKETATTLMQMAGDGRLPVDAVYCSAIHTHNGYGHWEKSPAIQLAFGQYRHDITDLLLQKSMEAIQLAQRRCKRARLEYMEASAPEFVINRIDPVSGEKDSKLRALTIAHASGQKAIVVAYSAHPVVLDTEVLAMSRDYPGYFTDQLVSAGRYSEAVFMAGMVGSHTVRRGASTNFQQAAVTGRGLANRLMRDGHPKKVGQEPLLAFRQVNVPLPPPQVRLSKNLAVRSWVFRLLFGELHASITVLRIGDLLMLGMPCDFSGEVSVYHGLDDYAASRGLELMITSFNGHYMGYVAADRHYDTSTSEEVRLMNWAGPHMGAYFAYIVKQITDKL